MKDRNGGERTKQQRKQTQKVTRILQKEIFFRNSYPREQKISNSKRKEQREESVRKDNREKTSVQREKKAGQTDDRGEKKEEKKQQETKGGRHVLSRNSRGRKKSGKCRESGAAFTFGITHSPTSAASGLSQVPGTDSLTSPTVLSHGMPRFVYGFSPLTDFRDNDVCRHCRASSLANEYRCHRYTSRR